MSRPPKPRISKRRLIWKWNRSKQVWDPYHRIRWTEGGKTKERAILLQWENDPKKLDELFWQVESGRHEKQIKPARYTWKEIVVLWRSDPRKQRSLNKNTKASYRREMDAHLMKNAHKDMRNTTRAAVRNVHDALSDKPRKADWRLQIISLLWNYAVEQQDWPLGPNPAKGIEKFGTQRPFEHWPDWMVNKLDTAPQNVRAAAELILGTGQRPSAAISMRRDQFTGEWMKVHDEKTDLEFETYCPARLRAFIGLIPKTGAHIIAKNLREPVGYSAVEKAFRTWRKDLGPEARPFTLHGLRKLAIIQLAEAGASDAEIQAVTNQSPETIAYYRQMANRKTLSKAAQIRREQNKNKT